MISRPFKIGLLVCVIAVGVMAVGGLHWDSVRLRARVAEARRQHDRLDRLRAENRRTQELVAQSQADQAGAAQSIHADVVVARRTVAELEKRAAEKHAQFAAKTATDAVALETNRDPRTGLTRLEHFQNSGQGAPASAFQTLVWAALKGDDAMLAQVSTISSPARTKAEALIARLPENTRAQWSPEKLAAMFFTGAFGEVTAAQVLAETPKDAGHVALSIRLAGGGKDATIPLLAQLGPSGWQVVFDDKLLGAVQKKIASAEGPPLKK